MVESAGSAGTVGIVGRLLFAVIDEVAHRVAIKAATHKHIVAAIIDTAIQIPGTGHVGKVMELAEMADIDTGTAIMDAAVGDAQRAVDAISGVPAGDAAAREIANTASLHDRIHGLTAAIFQGGCSDKADAVTIAQFGGTGHILLTADESQILHGTL